MKGIIQNSLFCLSLVLVLTYATETKYAWPIKRRYSTTIPILRIPPAGCSYNGKVYAPGSEISKGEDRENNWCFGSYCSHDGQIIYWDDFNCFPTTAQPPSLAPSTKSTTTAEATEKTIRDFLKGLFAGLFQKKNLKM